MKSHVLKLKVVTVRRARAFRCPPLLKVMFMAVKVSQENGCIKIIV